MLTKMKEDASLLKSEYERDRRSRRNNTNTEESICVVVYAYLIFESVSFTHTYYSYDSMYI